MIEVTPKYVTFPDGTKAIVVDDAQRKLDAARKKYNRAWDRGYLLEQKGGDGQAILDRANREYDAAKAAYNKARGVTV